MRILVAQGIIEDEELFIRVPGGCVMNDMHSNSSSSWWKEIERMLPYTFQDSYQEGFVFKMVKMHVSGGFYVLQGFVEKSWGWLPRFLILHWNTNFELEANKVW